MFYFPQAESGFRRQYEIAIDVWNYDMYWINVISGTVLLSSFVFTLKYMFSYKKHRRMKRGISHHRQDYDQVEGWCNKLDKVRHDTWMRIKPSLTSFSEVVDLLKDLYYCSTVFHQDKVLAIFLWIFALFAFLFNAFSIMLMTRAQYIKAFGIKDIDAVAESNYKLTKFTYLKIKRTFKENFIYHSAKDQENINVRKRMIFH